MNYKEQSGIEKMAGICCLNIFMLICTVFMSLFPVLRRNFMLVPFLDEQPIGAC